VRFVAKTEILLFCDCVWVWGCGGGGCVVLSSSLPPHSLDCSIDMYDESGFSSATFIFLSFIFSFHLSFLHVEVMQSVLWLLCNCAVFLVGDSTLQPTVFKMLISLLYLPSEEQAVSQ
jgi:hypothetical protein